MALIAATGLEFSYAAKKVLGGVSLAVDAGEVVSLVGPNGAGKTTLLKCLAGLLEGRGVVHYGSASLAGLPARERAHWRAYVAQHSGTLFPYRVDEVVRMGAAHRSRFYTGAASSRAVRAVLDEVGFELAATSRFDRLSGGERQQVLIARALIQESPILLFDEPTSALDLKHRASVVRALRLRAKGGAAVLMSLHDLDLASLASERLILLSRGQIAAEGPAAEVLTQPILEAAYEARVVCGKHPLRDAPTVELDPRAWS